MPQHTEQQHSPYTPTQLFDMVADVEKYPEFLPWCRAARVMNKTEEGFFGELIISFAHITESYTSKVTTNREAGTIEVIMVKGPFEHLTNNWKFTAIEGGTQIGFALDFKFRSKILEKLIGSLFSKATAKMVTAFKERSNQLYAARILEINKST